MRSSNINMALRNSSNKASVAAAFDIDVDDTCLPNTFLHGSLSTSCATACYMPTTAGSDRIMHTLSGVLHLGSLH